MGQKDKGVRAQHGWRMQEGDGGVSEMNGGEKRDQPSQTSSSWEKRQINSRRIELPMIIGSQHRLHPGMATLLGGVQNHWTLNMQTGALFFGPWSHCSYNLRTGSDLTGQWTRYYQMQTLLEIIQYWKDAQMTELIQNCYLPYTTGNLVILNDTTMPVQPVEKLL